MPTTAREFYGQKTDSTRIIRWDRARTVPVDGTFALVTFDPAAYTETDVWLHAAGEPATHGTWVGKVGTLGDHGAFGHNPDGTVFGARFGGALTPQGVALELVRDWMEYGSLCCPQANTPGCDCAEVAFAYSG
jgi:hypothetical protein